jgi:mRNA-degrading endonuclease RelE of RelBE toxin-antitoxin system
MPEILAGAPGKRMRVRSLPSNSIEKRLLNKIEVDFMVVAKAAQKVLDRADKPTVKKLNKALTNIENNVGHIEPLKQIQRGMEDDLYRYKMEHYRIIFKRTPSELTIKSITTKSNTKFRRTGCM